MTRERRITEIMLGYWNIIKGSRRFPSEEDMNSADISDVWDNCFLIRVSEQEGEEKRRYDFNYLGSALEGIYGTTADISPLAPAFSDRLNTRCDEVMNTASPVIEDDAFVNDGGQTVRYRQILLPLGPEGNNISHVLGGMRYKIYDS